MVRRRGTYRHVSIAKIKSRWRKFCRRLPKGQRRECVRLARADVSEIKKERR